MNRIYFNILMTIWISVVFFIRAFGQELDKRLVTHNEGSLLLFVLFLAIAALEGIALYTIVKARAKNANIKMDKYDYIAFILTPFVWITVLYSWIEWNRYKPRQKVNDCQKSEEQPQVVQEVEMTQEELWITQKD